MYREIRIRAYILLDVQDEGDNNNNNTSNQRKKIYIHTMQQRTTQGTIGNKGTQRMQTSLAAADRYAHIARILDLESQQISI